ncbi:recombinase family protein [Shewanella indica]|uniref:recombinase family protein n=1 Tax=Shewanella indica TaxID=768528 RepID=UPI002044719C|nr:recombinase family protein [Shewanella indica]
MTTSPKPPIKQPANPTSNSTPLAHSYIRFSSIAQEKGDSINRQIASATSWSEKRGIPLSDVVYRDLGISAFKKVDRPGLRQLTESIRAGHIRKGDYILLERLDRLSRKDLDIAQEEIKSILRMGVNVVAIEDNLELTPESVNDAQALIRIIILAENAHRQSREKSERIKAAYASARQRARDGKAVRRRLPCWLDVTPDGNTYTFHPVYLPIVQRIIELRHPGRGYSSIAKTLNAEGLPGRMGKSGSGTSKGWTGGSVREIVTSRALYGFYQPHITVEKERDDGTTKRVLQPDGEPIVDHYPPVIGYREWLAIQPDTTATAKNRIPAGGYNKTDRLSGVARCAVCGGRVALRIYRRPSKKAEGGTKDYRHWVCVAGYASGACSVTRAFPDLDQMIIKAIGHLEVVATPAPSTCSSSGAVDTIRATIDANKERAEQLQALLVDPEGGSVSFVYNALSTLQARIKELEAELEQLEKVEVDGDGNTTQADIDRLAGYVDDVELFNHELRRIVSAIRVQHFGKKGFRGVIEQVNGRRVGFVSTAPENPKRGHAKERIEFFARGLGIPEPGDVDLFPWETEQDD